MPKILIGLLLSVICFYRIEYAEAYSYYKMLRSDGSMPDTTVNEIMLKNISSLFSNPTSIYLTSFAFLTPVLALLISLRNSIAQGVILFSLFMLMIFDVSLEGSGGDSSGCEGCAAMFLLHFVFALLSLIIGAIGAANPQNRT